MDARRKLLPLNALVYEALRPSVAFGLALLPLALAFAALAAMLPLVPWFEQLAGVPPHSPVRDHPNGHILGILLATTLVTAFLLGWCAGWLLNVVGSRWVLGWSPAKVRAVYLHSEIPPDWLKPSDGTTTSLEQTSRDWEQTRAQGMLRFIVTRGILAWGVPMLVGMYVVPKASHSGAFAPAALAPQVVIYTLGGAAFGALTWWASERSYRRRALTEPTPAVTAARPTTRSR